MYFTAGQLQRDGSVFAGEDDLRAVFGQLLDAGVTMQGEQGYSIVAGDLALTSTRYEVPTTDSAGNDVPLAMVSAEVSRRRRMAHGGW